MFPIFFGYQEGENPVRSLPGIIDKILGCPGVNHILASYCFSAPFYVGPHFLSCLLFLLLYNKNSFKAVLKILLRCGLNVSEIKYSV